MIDLHILSFVSSMVGARSRNLNHPELQPNEFSSDLNSPVLVSSQFVKECKGFILLVGRYSKANID
jgi:hypothetical protein